MSLSDLQGATQASLPTVRRAVQELSEARWIHVVGQADANGGRPAMLFGIDSRLYTVVGLHLQLPGMRLIATNLAGQVLNEEKRFSGVVPSPAECIAAVQTYLAELRDEFPERHIIGIGIASPGFVDLNTGDIISIGRVPGWEKFPICRHLEAATGLPVHIANDVDCMAIAEFQYTRQSLDANLVYFGFDEGVKASLFLKGGLYKGSLGNVGLVLGNLLHVEGKSDMQRTMNLLTVIGVNRIFEETLEVLSDEERAPYGHILATPNPRERFTLILEHASQDLEICWQIVQDVTTAFSVAVANTILLIQPDVVVIGGLLTTMPPVHFSELERAIRTHLPALISHNTIIQQGKLASRSSAAIGANHDFLQHLISSRTTELLSLAR